MSKPNRITRRIGKPYPDVFTESTKVESEVFSVKDVSKWRAIPALDALLLLAYFVVFVASETVSWAWPGVPRALALAGHAVAAYALLTILLHASGMVLRSLWSVRREWRRTVRGRRTRHTSQIKKDYD